MRMLVLRFGRWEHSSMISRREKRLPHRYRGVSATEIDSESRSHLRNFTVTDRRSLQDGQSSRWGPHSSHTKQFLSMTVDRTTNSCKLGSKGRSRAWNEARHMVRSCPPEFVILAPPQAVSSPVSQPHTCRQNCSATTENTR